MLESQTLDTILKNNLTAENYAFVQKNIIYGPHIPTELHFTKEDSEPVDNIEIRGFTFCNEWSQRKVRIALFQNAIVEKTDAPIETQKAALLDLGRKAIELASNCGAQIFCFQEVWNMPMAFCTQKKLPWVEFAETISYEGPTTKYLSELAKKHNMVIISPILERCREDDWLWNSAVVIDNHGIVLGVSRKNHIPISGSFGETYYYNPSEKGHPVFHTEYGKIAIAICYDRHHPQCFFSYGLNGAEIVFNPSATIQAFSESFWPIEARDAAVKNKFYVAAINRVGKEEFPQHAITAGPFFGSSFIAGPDGSRTPGLSVDRNGILIGDLDLEKCSKKTSAERLGKSKIFQRQ